MLYSFLRLSLSDEPAFPLKKNHIYIWIFLWMSIKKFVFLQGGDFPLERPRAGRGESECGTLRSETCPSRTNSMYASSPSCSNGAASNKRALYNKVREKSRSLQWCICRRAFLSSRYDDLHRRKDRSIQEMISCLETRRAMNYDFTWPWPPCEKFSIRILKEARRLPISFARETHIPGAFPELFS